jgi:hypothetical protein
MSPWHPARLLTCTRHGRVQTTMRCEGTCDRVCKVERCPASTAYVDPARNRSNYFCEDCAAEYYEYWNER